MKDAIAEVVAELTERWRKMADRMQSGAKADALLYCAGSLADAIKDRLSSTPARALSEGDDPADCDSNADYIEFCAEKLTKMGFRVTGTTLGAIAAEHRRLAAGGLDSESRRLRAAEALEWVNDCSDSDLELIFAHSPMLAKRLAEKLATPSASVGGEVVGYVYREDGRLHGCIQRDLPLGAPLYAKPPALVVDDAMVERALVAGFAAHFADEPMGGSTWADFCKEADAEALGSWREWTRAALTAALAKEAPRG